MKNYEKIVTTLVEFLQSNVKNKGFDNVVYGLSGGIDSAVVAILCQKAFKEKSFALLMPALNSSKNSVDDALELCEKFEIYHKILPIKAPQNAFGEILENLRCESLRMGNICARLRMICLYDYSFVHKSLVIGTSNKSELMLGYGTIFGDMACAINPIGSLYKTEIFELARFLEVPKSILQKAPSADFYEWQSDEKELGFSYEVLDGIMQLLEKGKTKEAILQQGYSADAYALVTNRVEKMAFKRELSTIARL